MSLSLFNDHSFLAPFFYDAPFRALERQLADPSFAKLAAWQPRTDVSETDKEYKISVEIPGAKKENVKVEVKGNTLNISGKVEEEKKEENEKHHRYERTYGSFSRSFMLPSDANKDKVVANFADGVLRVNLEKVPKADKEAAVKDVKVN